MQRPCTNILRHYYINMICHERKHTRDHVTMSSITMRVVRVFDQTVHHQVPKSFQVGAGQHPIRLVPCLKRVPLFWRIIRILPAKHHNHLTEM